MCVCVLHRAISDLCRVLDRTGPLFARRQFATFYLQSGAHWTLEPMGLFGRNWIRLA